MFGKSFRLFRLFGFEVKIDLSWLVLAALITWTLAKGVFPHYHEDLSASTYWWMGAAGALGLFVSIVFHELAHSIMARQYGIPMRGITLFIFGGVAEMTDEPPNAKAEFVMAIAGPIASVLLGGVLHLLDSVLTGPLWSEPTHGVISYLAYINLILAAFNMVPAFPLDGGRVLRSALWGWKGSLRRATRISSQIGSGFGIFLIVLGVLWFMGGNFVGGIWWVLIGMFLRGASQMSYQQLLVRRALEGEVIERFMKPDPVTVSPSLSLRDLVEDYVYRYQHKMFPVVEDSQVRGCITTRQVKDVPREEWGSRTVGELTTACSDENTLAPHEDAVKALATMRRTGNSRLLVVDQDGRLKGIVSLKDLLNFLSLKVDLDKDFLQK